jgi:hypothetical protein
MKKENLLIIHKFNHIGFVQQKPPTYFEEEKEKGENMEQ